MVDAELLLQQGASVTNDHLWKFWHKSAFVFSISQGVKSQILIRDCMFKPSATWADALIDGQTKEYCPTDAVFVYHTYCLRLQMESRVENTTTWRESTKSRVSQSPGVHACSLVYPTFWHCGIQHQQDNFQWSTRLPNQNVSFGRLVDILGYGWTWWLYGAVNHLRTVWIVWNTAGDEMDSRNTTACVKQEHFISIGLLASWSPVFSFPWWHHRLQDRA